MLFCFCFVVVDVVFVRGGGGGGGMRRVFFSLFSVITFQKRNTSISILVSSRYDTVYIWETDRRKMLLGITG